MAPDHPAVQSCCIAAAEPRLPLPDPEEFIKGLKVSFPSLLNALIYARV